MLANIAEPASWLLKGIRQAASLLPASATAPLARLLLSCAATELKVARVAGLQPGLWISKFMDAAFLRDFNGAASSPTVASLMLPRLAATVPTGSPLFACDAFMFAGSLCRSLATSCRAVRGDSLTLLAVMTSCHMSVLLHRSVAEVAVFSQATRPHAYLVMSTLAGYADNTVQVASLYLSQQQGHGQLSPEVTARLAQPILMLLRSPLLGLLASLQHVAVGSTNTFNNWAFPEGSNIPPLHLMPAYMAPDALDSKLAMQVGHSLFLPGLPVLLSVAKTILANPDRDLILICSFYKHPSDCVLHRGVI